MAISFPTSLDTLSNPTTGSYEDVVGHAGQHSDDNDAIEALEAKVGINSSAVNTSLDYLLKNTSSSNPGHKHTLVNGATDITASVAEINKLAGLATTAVELGYVSGVTSAIQTQLGTKAPLASPTFTGTVTMPVALTGLALMTSGVVSAVAAPSGTIVGTTDTQTLTAKTLNTTVNLVFVNNAIAASSNAATVPITYRLNTVTNNSAATLTITMTTTDAVDGQVSIVRILDASAAAQTIAWVNTENSDIAAPTTSNGSTTLFRTAGFIFNGGSTKWRCVANC